MKLAAFNNSPDQRGTTRQALKMALIGCLLAGASFLPETVRAESGRILMVVTSAGQIRDNKPTGLWLEEFAVPYL